MVILLLYLIVILGTCHCCFIFTTVFMGMITIISISLFYFRLNYFLLPFGVRFNIFHHFSSSSFCVRHFFLLSFLHLHLQLPAASYIASSRLFLPPSFSSSLNRLVCLHHFPLEIHFSGNYLHAGRTAVTLVAKHGHPLLNQSGLDTYLLASCLLQSNASLSPFTVYNIQSDSADMSVSP